MARFEELMQKGDEESLREVYEMLHSSMITGKPLDMDPDETLGTDNVITELEIARLEKIALRRTPREFVQHLVTHHSVVMIFFSIACFIFFFFFGCREGIKIWKMENVLVNSLGVLREGLMCFLIIRLWFLLYKLRKLQDHTLQGGV